jgi:16S rRNA G966 N2-methylase RsmD
LSYEGSIVLDFFAGSGTTGRICIEENRHSIMVDADASLNTYFSKHIENIGVNFFQKPYKIIKNMDIKELLTKMNNESKDIEILDNKEEYQEQENTIIIPTSPKQERVAVYAVAANYDGYEKRLV